MPQKEGGEIMARYSKAPAGARPRFATLLTDEQLRDLKKVAADMGTDTSALVNQAVAEFLERHRKDKVTKS